MPMVSLKTDDESLCCPERNEYGYGTSLSLNDDQCEALGIKMPPPAGSVVTIMARAYVKSSTGSVEVDGDDKGPDVSMCLQITDMELKPAGSGMYDASVMNP